MRTIFVVVAILAVAIGVNAELREVGFNGYTSRLWEARDGLPDQTAQAFAQTRDGSLWIGTKGGLLRFDGAHFTTYGPDVAPAALQRGINCLLVSEDGALWIGTEGGGVLSYRGGGAFRTYPTRGGLSNQFIRSIFQDRNGTVWVGADQGLFQVSGSSLTQMDSMHGIPAIFARAIVQDKQGYIWVGGTTLLQFDGNSFLREYSLPGGPNRNLITSMYSARDGTLWLGTISGLRRLTSSGDLASVPGITSQASVIQETKGRLWIGTIGQGIFYQQAGSLFHIATGNLPSRTVNAVFEDRERNLWLGTQAGVVRLSKTPVTIVPFPGGADSSFETLSLDGRGTIWVATVTHLFRIQNETASPYTFPGLTALGIRTLLPDRQGGFWVGTDGAGLLHLNGKHIQRFSLEQRDLINNFVRAILIAKDGSLWIGTDGGLTHLDGAHSRSYDTHNGLVYFSITALLQDRIGGIWVGTSRGLAHIVRGAIVQDTVTEKLRQEQISSICQDSSGEIWFGTSSGLYGFKDGKLVHLTTAQGLVSNTIYVILDDSKGNLWIGSPNSISRIPLNELDRFQAGSQVTLTFYRDSADLESAALYSGLQPEGAVSPNGEVWFPSNKGAVRIATDKIVPTEPSPIRIDEVAAQGGKLPLDGRIVLKPGNTRLEISYAVIHLGSQESLRYRYKMDGLESWNEARGRHTAYYTHLPPGQYRFRVQAYEISNPGAVSEASILIVQEPHFYATLWFFACCAIASLSVVFAIYRLRLRQMRMRFHIVNQERARVAREMHDTVIQGCVGVSSLLEAVLEIEAADPPPHYQLLNYASEQVRNTIESAREAVWVLRSTSISSSDTAALCDELSRQVQAGSGIPVRFKATGVALEFDEFTTRELMMTVREALANAVAHANPRYIDVDVCFRSRGLKIEVRDDGRGFDPSADLSRDGHYGIVGMKERVLSLRGSFEIESNPGRGTVVRIVVPCRRSVMNGLGAGNAAKATGKN
jgi:ligand-binding sensor domain-containing protein/signal transduction histidine kinase